VDKRKGWYGQYVTAAEWDDAFDHVEESIRDLSTDLGLCAGITGGATSLVVTQHYVGSTPAPNLTVDVSAGSAYDDLGKRIVVATAQNVDMSEDHNGTATTVSTAGKHKCVSLFVKPLIVESEPHAKKSGPPDVNRCWDESFEFYVVQGAETLTSAPLDYPVLGTGMVLLRDVKFTYGMTQIVTGSLVQTRTDATAYGGSQTLVCHTAPSVTPTHAIGRRDVISALGDLLDYYADHVGGSADNHDAADVNVAAHGGDPYSLTDGTLQNNLQDLLDYINASVRSRTVCASGTGTPLVSLSVTDTFYPVPCTALRWQSESGMWNVANGDRLVATWDGVYAFSIAVRFEHATALPTMVQVYVTRNGSGSPVPWDVVVAPTTDTAMGIVGWEGVLISGTDALHAGEYFYIQAKAKFGSGTHTVKQIYATMWQVGNYPS